MQQYVTVEKTVENGRKNQIQIGTFNVDYIPYIKALFQGYSVQF